MAKKRICIILSAILCLCLGAVALIQFLPKEVDVSAAAYSTTDFKMVNNSSIKKDANANGIRFMTFIGDETAQANKEYWTTHEMGTLFIPEKAMKLGDELKIDGTYSGISPVVAKFDGKVENLTVNSNYSGGKIFNAVLDLTKFNTNAGALNTKVVARTYVKDTATNEVTYLDAIKYAPALSAGRMIQAGDTDQMLLKYIDKVKLVGVKNINVSTTDPIALNVSTNVEGFPFEYSTDNGSLNGNQFVPDEDNESTITVTLVGGKSATFKVSVVKKNTITLERKYYAEKDAREINASGSVYRNSSSDYLVLQLSNVDSVSYNGEKLRKDKDYVIDAGKGELKIEKAALLTTDKSNELVVYSSANGNTTYEVNLIYENESSLTDSKLSSYLNSDEQFDIYSYQSIGKPSERTQEVFNAEVEEYFDMGMVYMQTGSYAGINGTSNSQNPTLASATNLKTALDTASALGYKNSVILTDNGINDSSRLRLNNGFNGVPFFAYEPSSSRPFNDNAVFNPADHPGLSTDFKNQCVDKTYYQIRVAGRNTIVYGNTNTYPSMYKGSGATYSSETAFTEAVEKNLLRYMNHSAFGGLKLRDEPSVEYIPLVAEYYKAINNVFAKYGITDKKFDVTLLAFYPNNKWAWPGGNSISQSNDAALYESYKNYLKMWLECSGSEELQIDIYSLYNVGIYRYHIVNLQLAAEACAEYNAKTGKNAKIIITNSSWKRSEERYHTYQDMAWMNNITLAYGASNFVFYTYNKNSETVDDNGQPLNSSGQRTPIYDYVREVSNKAQVLAPVILNFDYVKGAFVNNLNSSDEPKDTANGNIYSKTQVYTSNSINQGLTKVTKVKANDGKYSWLVNELKDSSKGNYMYAVMNVIDSLNTTSNHATKKSITLTFASGYTKAWVYRDGKFTVESLNGSTLTLSNMIGGDCCYVIPF